MKQQVQDFMLDNLPIEILLEIYQYLSPEQAPAIALINKMHAQSISNPFWGKKFEIHFPYLLNELPKEKRNWCITFKIAYQHEYARLSKPQRAWFSLVKEGKPTELEGLSINDLSLNDAKGISLISWAHRKNYQHVLDYWWNNWINKIAIPFLNSQTALKQDEYSSKLLSLAIMYNQREKMKFLLSLVSLNTVTQNILNSLLINAVSYNRLDIVELLLDSGANVNCSSTAFNNTPLQSASAKGCTEIAKLLLEKGANINLASTHGATPLLFAIENRHPDTIHLLLQYNADTSLQLTNNHEYHENFGLSPGDTPLIAAIKLDQKETVQKLLNKAPFTQDTLNSLLIKALGYNRLNIVELLLDYGANVNCSSPVFNNTPLQIASAKGYTEIAKLLLEKGANINLASTHGATPLLFAIENRHPDTIHLLLQYNADTSLQLTNNHEYHENFGLSPGDTPLIAAIKLDQKETVQKLLNKAPFTQDTLNSLLIKALGYNRLNIVELLLDSGANVNYSLGCNNTPLQIASAKGYTEIAELLLKKGANINLASTHGATPLLFAIENNHLDTIDLLLQHNADISVQLTKNNKYHENFGLSPGDTPLIAAIKLDQKETVQKLLNKAPLVAKVNKNTLVEAAQKIVTSSRQGSYAQERTKKWNSFFKPRDVRTDQLVNLARLGENSSVEDALETFITISTLIHQEYHLGGDSTLAKLINQALNEALTDVDEVPLQMFKNF